jgi:hypothetical protein
MITAKFFTSLPKTRISANLSPLTQEGDLLRALFQRGKRSRQALWY